MISGVREALAAGVDVVCDACGTPPGCNCGSGPSEVVMMSVARKSVLSCGCGLGVIPEGRNVFHHHTAALNNFTARHNAIEAPVVRVVGDNRTRQGSVEMFLGQGGYAVFIHPDVSIKGVVRNEPEKCATNDRSSDTVLFESSNLLRAFYCVGNGRKFAA